jgi:hypothetical protein
MARPASWARRTLLVAAVLAGLVALYLVITFVQVWSTARADQTGSADAIVVLGPPSTTVSRRRCCAPGSTTPSSSTGPATLL